MLSISVDLEPRGKRAVSDEALCWTTRRLVELFNRAEQPVTWLVREPAAHDALRWAREADVAHEAGLVIDADGADRENGRSRFAMEVLRGKTAAAKAGWTVSTLAMAAPPAREQLDFLVKQGITAIRAGAGGGFTSIRYGLWQAAPQHQIAASGRISNWLMRRRILKAVAQPAANDTVIHMSIDAAAMAASSASGSLGGMERLLDQLRERAASGGLEIGTIGQAVAKLMQPRSVRAARSILRAA